MRVFVAGAGRHGGQSARASACGEGSPRCCWYLPRLRLYARPGLPRATARPGRE
jgi:hypothetical protein